MYCSHCGTQNPDGAKFCRSCGTDLTATTPIPAIDAGREELTDIEIVRQQLASEYEILDELGRGGMAIVFKAREKQLERDVAIKVLPFSLSFDKEFVERFQREARTSAKLEHPNIIPIYRVGRSGRVIYFVMKFLRGRPLSAVLRERGALPPDEIRRILAEVGGALGYAHRSGIVHRDIKPDNIMFDEHGHAVVTDFGIAKAASGSRLTGTGMAIGTPHYMSPEQARAQGLDGRSDLYSLGVVAYQCLVGAVPFDGEDSFSIGYKHIMEPLPEPALRSREERELFEIVKKLMAKSPDERFQTAEDMVTALELGGYVASGISHTRAGPPLAAAPGSPGAKFTTAPTTPLPRITGMRPGGEGPARSSAVGTVFAVIGITVVVLGVAGAVLWSQGLVQPYLRSAGILAGGDSTAEHRDTASLDSLARLANTPASYQLTGLPEDAAVTLDGNVVQGSTLSLPPGPHVIHVTAPGHQPWTDSVTAAGGEIRQVAVAMKASVRGAICDQYGPEYNRGNVCWDQAPRLQSSPFVPWSDVTVAPRPVIILFHIDSTGTTVGTSVLVPSNVDDFNTKALQFAGAFQWTPARKHGQAVEAFQQFMLVAHNPSQP